MEIAVFLVTLIFMPVVLGHGDTVEYLDAIQKVLKSTLSSLGVDCVLLFLPEDVRDETMEQIKLDFTLEPLYIIVCIIYKDY